jgi:hypothetical protein
LEYFLFAGYLILFAWIVTRIKFFTRTDLTNAQLIIIFLLKVMAGILYGWIGVYYGSMAQMVDTWGFHYYGLQQYQLLQTDPRAYFTNIFYNPYEDGFYRFFSSDHSFWSNLQGNAMIKIVSVFDIFSFGNYYINVIFYSFSTFWGSIGIYRVMSDVFPGKKLPLILSVFLIPSFIFWSNGIHKEGFIFTGMSLVIYAIYFAGRQNRMTAKRVLCIFTGLLLIFIFRSFLLFTIIPAITAWQVAKRFPQKTLAVFFIIYAIFATLFFTARYVSPKLDFPDAVIAKQKDFQRLQGGSSEIPVKEMKPEPASFIMAMPQAFITAAIRPFPTEAKNLLSLFSALEVSLVLLAFILFLFFRKRLSFNYAFIYFCIFFSFTTLLVIGYTANFLGAIVRYRSIILPFLVIPMAALTDWERVARLLFFRKKP